MQANSVSGDKRRVAARLFKLSALVAVLIPLDAVAQNPVDTIFRTIDTIQRQQQQQQRVAPPPVTTAQGPSLVNRSASEISAMQSSLQTLGYYVGPIDGSYGPGTSQAVRAWQAASGLPQTGTLTDDQLMSVIQQAAAKRSAGNAPAGGDLRRLVVGKDAASIPDNQVVAGVIRSKFGQRLLDSLRLYQVNPSDQVEVRMIGDYAYGVACQPHVCPDSQARYVMAPSQIWIGIVRDGRISFFGEPPADVRQLLLTNGKGQAASAPGGASSGWAGGFGQGTAYAAVLDPAGNAVRFTCSIEGTINPGPGLGFDVKSARLSGETLVRFVVGPKDIPVTLKDGASYPRTPEAVAPLVQIVNALIESSAPTFAVEVPSRGLSLKFSTSNARNVLRHADGKTLADCPTGAAPAASGNRALEWADLAGWWFEKAGECKAGHSDFSRVKPFSEDFSSRSLFSAARIVDYNIDGMGDGRPAPRACTVVGVEKISANKLRVATRCPNNEEAVANGSPPVSVYFQDMTLRGDVLTRQFSTKDRTGKLISAGPPTEETRCRHNQ